MFSQEINTRSLVTKTKIHPAQRDIFTDQLINIESPHYNIGLYLKLKGKLNIEKLREAATRSPRVFDVFKMRFDISCGDFLGYIDEDYERFEMSEQNFSHLKNPQKAAENWMQQQFNTPFELQKEKPLFQQSLLKISDEEHWFFFRFHHIITDAFGFAIWINYISHRYVSLINGKKQFPFDYPSYFREAIKAGQYYNSEEYNLPDKYWKNKIKEKPQPLLRKKHLNTSPISANFYIEVDQNVSDLLSQLQVSTKSNLQQLTIAAFLIYLKKTSEETEFTLAIPYHKRGADGQRNMMGMFSGILPFKQLIEEDIIAGDLIKSIKNSIKEDYAYRNYLIGDLSRSLKLGLSDSYLCDVVINYVPFNFDLSFGEDLAADIHWLSSEYERSPLQICWRHYADSQPLELGLHFGLEYFDKTEIELLANRLIYILQQLSSSLDKNISNISILPPREKSLLEGFNKTVAASGNNKSIVSAFKEQAEKNPHNIAVTYEQERCSFRELDEKSDQLAFYLLKKGVKKDMLVPICIGRNVEMIIGIMGILKAGAAYVPVDPENPEERIRHILEDTGAEIIVSNKKSSSKISGVGNITTLLLDDDWLEISREMPNGLLPEVSPKDLAYVIYTSGSTGRPKGVMVEHQAYMNINNFYHKILPGEQTVLTCAYVFDVSVLEIFSSLLGGGCLNIPPYSTTTDPNTFAEFLYHKKIATAYIHPMHLARVSAVLGGYTDCYLKKILIGVEPISKGVVKWYLEKNIQVINGYGPTETSICATFYFANNTDNYSILPIGKPIGNYEVFILDNNREPVPVGVAGEIYIGGAGLARGYLNRAGLTGEKFIKNVFSKDINARLYKTGDVGRWLTDGNIEYVGRIDNQVKIRGYRIELGEIENALLQSKLVKECVVIAAADNEGHKRLVGYAVPHSSSFNRQAIASHLKSRLPEYMVPAIWVQMKSIPFTANGKVNRKALPEPDLESVAVEEFVKPETDLEIKLAGIWQKLLRLEKIGMHDNFFHLGGHSVIAVQAMIRLEKETGIVLPISVLSAHPTIASLSAFINSRENKKQWKSLVSLKSSGTKVPLYIVHGAGLNVLIFKDLADNMDADQPVYGLQAKGLDGISEPLDKIEDIAAFYISEMLQQNPRGPYAIAGYSSGGLIAFEMAKQLKEGNKEVTIVALFDSFAYISDHFKPIYKKYWNKVKTAALKIIYTFVFFFQEPKLIAKYKIDFIRRNWGQLIGKLGKRKPADKYYLFTKKISDMLDNAFNNYRITPYNGVIDVFRAKKRTYYIPDFKFLGWKPFALKGVRVHKVPGEHKDLLFPPHVKVFAKILQDALDRT